MEVIKIVCQKEKWQHNFIENERPWKRGVTSGHKWPCKPCKLKTCRGGPNVERCKQGRGIIPFCFICLRHNYSHQTMCPFWSKSDPTIDENLKVSFVGPYRNSLMSKSLDFRSWISLQFQNHFQQEKQCIDWLQKWEA